MSEALTVWVVTEAIRYDATEVIDVFDNPVSARQEVERLVEGPVQWIEWGDIGDLDYQCEATVVNKGYQILPHKVRRGADRD